MSYCPNCGYHLGGFSVPQAACPNEITCQWRQISRNEWTCAHGVTVFKHPRGWCDGGCCR